MRFLFLIFLFNCTLLCVSANCDSILQAKDTAKALECYSENPSDFESLAIPERLAIARLRIDNGLFIPALEDLLRLEQISADFTLSLHAEWSHLMGLSYYYLSDYPKALQYFQQSIQLFENTDSTNIIAGLYLNIGNVYSKLNQHENAGKYLFLALDKYSDIQDKDGIAKSYNNLGNHYRDKFDFDSAVYYFDSSLKINTGLDNYKEIAAIYNNKGLVYDMKGEPLNALANYTRSLKLNKQYGTGTALGDSYLQMGTFYNSVWQYDSAYYYLTLSKEIAQKQRSLDLLYGVYFQLINTFEKTGKHQQALDAYKTFARIKDNLSSEEGIKRMTQLEMQFQFDQAHKEQQFRIERQRLLIYASLICLMLMMGVAGLLLRNYRIKQRDNRLLATKNSEISKQRDEITEQKKEITDSIFYASRIQQAVLPPLDQREQILGKHFILYKPRDIVSGDYYWLAEKNGIAYFSAADCTGHGVPGAFMSLLGISFLNEIISNQLFTTPSQILGELRRKVISYLHQTGKDGGNKDGMDMGLVAINFKEYSVKFAGAYNSLYLIRNGELIEHKADRMPVSVYIKNDDFSEKHFDALPGDMIYLYSDGYADQFGGGVGKKLKTKNFKQILIECAYLPIEEQRDFLYRKFTEWKGDFEQVDDIIIAGIQF